MQVLTNTIHEHTLLRYLLPSNCNLPEEFSEPYPHQIYKFRGLKDYINMGADKILSDIHRGRKHQHVLSSQLPLRSPPTYQTSSLFLSRATTGLSLPFSPSILLLSHLPPYIILLVSLLASMNPSQHNPTLSTDPREEGKRHSSWGYSLSESPAFIGVWKIWTDRRMMLILKVNTCNRCLFL